MAVAPVVGGDGVLGPEAGRDADRHRLLADRQVDEARHLAVGEQRLQPLLGTADHQHAFVKHQQAVGAVVARDGSHGGSSGTGGSMRSEEHTSELQSLMRNSYAVFCLNKKKTTTTNQHKT